MIGLGASAAEKRLLPEGRFAGPMPWVIAIMMFLTALAVAGGLSMRAAAGRLGGDLGRSATVQVIVADPAAREREAQAVMQLLSREGGVRDVHRLADGEMQALLRPWLGDAGLDRDLPLPAMIDFALGGDGGGNGGDGRIGRIAANIRAAAPHARVDDHSGFIGPLIGLVRSLGLLAAMIVAMMAGATGAAVVLAARAALDTHRRTIEVMHMMGATDVQIARLFQRRIALDAAFGALVGVVAATAIVLSLGRRVAEIGSGLVGSIGLPWTGWLAMLALPPLAGGLALLVARVTVQRALGRAL